MFKSRKFKIIGGALLILIAGLAQVSFSIFPISINSMSNITSDRTNENLKIRAWKSVHDFKQDVAVFETVFWDPRDTESLRELIREDKSISELSILEIGTGSGLLSLCCLQAGAKRVVATDVNSNAIENASFNAEHLGLQDSFGLRLVPLTNSSAFSVIHDSETFDLIISNPPWVNQTPQTIDEYALYDANFDLMKSLFAGLKDHLNPGGRVLLAYGCVDAIKTIQKLSDEHGLQYTKLDPRKLDKLPEEFLPGMMVQLQFPLK